MKNKRLKSLLITFAILIIGYLSLPLPKPIFQPDYSTVVLDKDGKILRAFLNQTEQWQLPPDSSNIPDKLKTAVIEFEDRYFYYHPGVNPFSIVQASFKNISSAKIISGASTLTMQVARLMKPKRRTFANKFVEILQALKIELWYSKEQILQLYLNHAPYGGNIRGYRTASLRYFRKMPDQLTWAEAAMLAVLPNAPGLISPQVNRAQLQEKRDGLLLQLKENGTIDNETYRLAKLEPVPEGSNPIEMHAPHAARLLKRNDSSKHGIIHTTLDKDLQIQTELLLKQHMDFLKSYGINNGAALVADTKSRKIRAYVGSQEFFDFDNQGQVDGVQALRSSGSILKPFLFALSIENGTLLPETKIQDVPSFYGTFSPSNADETHAGLVTAKEALIQSLNVPAVRLLYTYGTYPFYKFLKTAGLKTLFRSSDDYGLSLILGGAEVTLVDMATLFCGLANEGQFTPLTLVKGVQSSQQTPQKLLSKASSYLTLEVLRELKRPGNEYYWEQYQRQWPFAWKTGTSYGQRDAWAIGVSPEWTIAVWVGNFDGKGNTNLGGARSAAPLLFDIFNALPKKNEESWFEKPEEDLAEIELCRDTGYKVGPNCRSGLKAKAPYNSKPIKICPYHESIFVAVNEQVQVCSICWQGMEYKKIPVLNYPPKVVKYLQERGHNIGQMIPHKPGCSAQVERNMVEILYPEENTRIWLPRDFGSNLQKVTLQAASRGKNRKLFWYVDDRFIGETQSKHVQAMTLKRGWHDLEVIDNIGNRARNRFYVDLRK